jgi:hypothetical protein
MFSRKLFFATSGVLTAVLLLIRSRTWCVTTKFCNYKKIHDPEYVGVLRLPRSFEGILNFLFHSEEDTLEVVLHAQVKAYPEKSSRRDNLCTRSEFLRHRTFTVMGLVDCEKNSSF